MNTISTLVEETREPTTFVGTTKAATSLAQSFPGRRIYTSAGEVIYALDGSVILSLYETPSFEQVQ